MFGGVTHLSLDLKHRIILPAKYKDELLSFDNKLVITLESMQCLIIYPEATWVDVRQKIQHIPTGAHPLVKSYQRLVLGYAETVLLDKSARLLIPQSFQELITLDKELVLVGLGNRFELWNAKSWQEETNAALMIPKQELATLLNGFIL